MKLHFKTSQSTTLDHQIIIDRIVAKLEGNKYTVISLRDDVVAFYDSPWKLMWNFQAVRRLDGGRFELTGSGDGLSVTLNYYLNPLPQLLIIAALLIGLISQGQYDAIIFFILFYLVAGIVQVAISKNVAKETLSEILGTNDDN